MNDSQFKDYKDINQDGKKYNNDKLNKIRIHQKLQKLNLDNVMMDFDATGLNLSDIYVEKSVKAKTESDLAFKLEMNDV